MVNKKILLSGATGFLGSHLLRAFLEKGWEVSIIKRSFSDVNRIRDMLSMVDYIDCDKMPMEPIFEKNAPYDAVVHTATCYGRNNKSFLEVIQSNLHFPIKLLENSISFNTPIFFNTSTYFNKSMIQCPYLNAYTLSKQQFEDWGKLFSTENKIGFTNLRLEHMYGPDDSMSKFTANIFDKLKKNIPKIELTPGNQKRDFIYIDDVVSAYILMMEKINDDAMYSEYDIGTGEATSIREFVELAKEISGSRSNLLFGALPYRQNEIMFSRAKNEPLKKIGWIPKYSLKHGLFKSLLI